MAEKKFNLFVYGSLRDRGIFQSVSGFSFTLKPSRIDDNVLFAELAFLPHHRKISPDNVYYYAVADPSSRIEGFLIHDVPEQAMTEIDSFEGKRYQRQSVKVNTAKGPIKAEAYLVSHESMKKHFGDRFHVNLIHELWLRKRIERFLRKTTRPGERTIDAELERQARRELLGTTERDLVITHYGSDAISDYSLGHELDRPKPSVRHLYNEADVKPFIKNYLVLVIKQVLLNQLESKIHSRYRYELDHMYTSERYFNRSISLLVALGMINRNKSAVDMIIQRCLEKMPYERYDLIDYVKYAVRAARTLFDKRVVKSNLSRIHASLQPGLTPLGAEIELSNLGFAAVEPQRSMVNVVDRQYDGFQYFSDFHLDVLSWKLGGYIDDHTGSTDQKRRRGFLELAPGRLNVEGEISRPATSDPWLLNQLIGAIVAFYDVKPHSLHLSFQLRKNQIGKQKVLPLSFVKCLLALGGGLQRKNTGAYWVSRMGHDEITQREYGEELVFARTSKRSWHMADDEITGTRPMQATTHIQQYKFIRLEERANYEPLIMCLKGLQLEYNPADYLNAEQLKASPKLRREYAQLKLWAQQPTEINSQNRSRFLNTVYKGLMNEAHHRPAHKLHYINWALGAIDVQLRMSSKKIKET